MVWKQNSSALISWKLRNVEMRQFVACFPALQFLTPSTELHRRINERAARAGPREEAEIQDVKAVADGSLKRSCPTC